jgi:hypothetical protein
MGFAWGGVGFLQYLPLDQPQPGVCLVGRLRCNQDYRAVLADRPSFSRNVWEIQFSHLLALNRRLSISTVVALVHFR